jgi:hypothetical protein
MIVEASDQFGYTRAMRRTASEDVPQVPGLMTVKQAATARGVSTTAIYHAIENGSLHPQKIGEILVLSAWEVAGWQPPPRGRKKGEGRAQPGANRRPRRRPAAEP